jgi:hypothetical protein
LRNQLPNLSYRVVDLVLKEDVAERGRRSSPENVIVTVKQVCGLPLLTFAGDTDSRADGNGSRKLSDVVFKAAIEEYYETSLR